MKQGRSYTHKRSTNLFVLCACFYVCFKWYFTEFTRRLSITSFFKFPNHLFEKENSWLSSDVTKTHTPKSQGLLRFYLLLAKDLLKINFCASFKRDNFFHFENIALSNFASLLRMTLMWRPWRPSHMLKNNFIAWYYALWEVKVLENVFRGIICSFAVNNWSNLTRYWNQMLALFPAAIFVLFGGAQIWRPHSEPYKFLLQILKKNSAAENCTDLRLGQFVNLSIFYNIRNSWLQAFQGFDFSFRWLDSENHQ